MTRATWTVWMALAGASLLAPGAAVAGDAPPSDAPPSDADVASAINAFSASFSKAGADERPALVVSFAALQHPRVGERLEAIGEDEKVDAVTRAGCFMLLAERGRTDTTIAPRIVRWLAGQAAVASKAQKKGEIGVPINPKSGEVDANSAEVKRAIAEGEGRAKVLAAAIGAAVTAGAQPKEAGDVLRPFFQAPFDGLAVAALRAAALWKPKDALPDLLGLFRMYPKESRWESGAVVHAGGNNASAQRAWMVMFGHPLKQRPRPDVVRALVAAIQAITSTKLDSPEALDAHLRSESTARSEKR